MYKRNSFSRREDIKGIISSDKSQPFVPESVRAAFLFKAEQVGVSLEALYSLACRQINKFEEHPTNEDGEPLSIYPELVNLLRYCKWYHFFDIVEATLDNIGNMTEYSIQGVDAEEEIEDELNMLMSEEELEWRIESGSIKKKTVAAIMATSQAPVAEPSAWAANQTEPVISRPKTALSYDLAIDHSVLAALGRKWRAPYFSSPIGSSEIAEWLQQFAAEDQALMARLLEHFEFYSRARVIEESSILANAVLSECGLSMSDMDLPTKKVVIVPWGKTPVKSSYTLTRIFLQSNGNPRAGLVVHHEDIGAVLDKHESIQAIILIDDVIGSGDSVLEFIRKELATSSTRIQKKRIAVIVGSIAGAVEGIEKVSAAQEIPFPLKVVVNTPMRKCFDPSVLVFDSDQDRERALRVATQKGRELFPSDPLGKRDGQMILAFFDNCPNNTLPIIWSRGNEKVRWFPLFERLSTASAGKTRKT